LIDRAARASGKNRAEFIREASRRAAEEANPSCASARRPSPPFRPCWTQRPTPRLIETMRTKAPWEQG